MAKIVNKDTPAPEKAGDTSGLETTQVSAPETPPESENNSATEAVQPPASTGGAPDPEKAPAAAPKAPAKAKLPSTERPYLDSPRPFGIWIGGVLVRFAKGKTVLTAEQAEALKAHPYTSANGAEVVE